SRLHGGSSSSTGVIHTSGLPADRSSTDSAGASECSARLVASSSTGGMPSALDQNGGMTDGSRQKMTTQRRGPLRCACQGWWPWRARVGAGVTLGRVHCGTGRLVGPQLATPPASVRRRQVRVRSVSAGDLREARLALAAILPQVASEAALVATP